MLILINSQVETGLQAGRGVINFIGLRNAGIFVLTGVALAQVNNSGGSVVKNLSARCERRGFSPWVGKILMRVYKVREKRGGGWEEEPLTCPPSQSDSDWTAEILECPAVQGKFRGVGECSSQNWPLEDLLSPKKGFA